MATLPKGARPLQNPIGTAPGVRVEHEGTLIYVLPGVPAELEAIYAESVEPELRRRFKTGVWIEGHVVAQCSDEAQVADVLREVAPRHPEVYVKSLARPFPDAEKSGLRILVAARADRSATAREEIEEALTDLAHTLERADIPVLERHVKAQTDREGGNDGSGTQSRHH
jgi:molybdopterin-biosynthesis enzyme MoeA-like protein